MNDHINISDMIPGAMVIEGNYRLVSAEVNCDSCMVRGILADDTGTIIFIQNVKPTNIGTVIVWRNITSRPHCKHLVTFEPNTMIHIRGVVVKVNGNNTLLLDTIQRGSKYVEYHRTC